MAEPVTIVISATALAISAATAWLTLFRRGRVRMTQPTVIFFGPDGGTPNRSPRRKVFLRTLLFATSKRGRVIECMHVRLSRGETRQNFNIWVYGDDKLVRGSGLFVGETGIASNHHFLLPEDASPFKFLPGKYAVDVFAKVLGDRSHRLLFSQSLDVTDSLAKDLEDSDAGLYFDWGPDSAHYHPHIDRRRTPLMTDRMAQFLPGIPDMLRETAEGSNRKSS